MLSIRLEKKEEWESNKDSFFSFAKFTINIMRKKLKFMEVIKMTIEILGAILCGLFYTALSLDDKKKEDEVETEVEA